MKLMQTINQLMDFYISLFTIYFEDLILNLSLTKILNKSLGRPKMVLTGGWLDRDSTVDRYTYTGSYLSGSLAWSW